MTKAEFFAGPLDGDKLPVPEDAADSLHFASVADLTLVHQYTRNGKRGYQWQGLVDRNGVERVFSLSVGERRQ